jgi:hypothetical protein
LEVFAGKIIELNGSKWILQWDIFHATFEDTGGKIPRNHHIRCENGLILPQKILMVNDAG